jgi:hypothetical protein
MDLSRRRFLGLTAAFPSLIGAACTDRDEGDGWNRGPLQHLLPNASHRSFNIKASFTLPASLASSQDPVLRVGDRLVPGERQDTSGRFWAFRVTDLEPDTEFTLRLLRSGTGEALCDSWPLRTLPAPDASPDRLRVASFTCAGGGDLPIPPALFHAFKPVEYRRRLFDLLLEREPDLVVANGDHVYFDLPWMESLQSHPLAPLVAPFVRGSMARFDPDAPVLGSPNEVALTTVGDDQIASIYGVRFRSTPIFFITDDHDYFDNDDATPQRVTFPPDDFHASLRNALQRLYFPEFIADDPVTARLPGLELTTAIPLSTHFGRVRYGDLFSGLLYDCGGYLSLGDDAGLVPRSVESWLLDETRREDTKHLVHFPSHPMGWTAGKWREWYRDVLESEGSLVEAIRIDERGGKFEWQPGWWAQHQRLLAGLGAQEQRRGLIVSGDLHALAAVRIEASGALALDRNPVHSVLSGAVGVGDLGWPSRARGVEARTPEELSVETLLELEERNGFTLLDCDGSVMRIETLGTGPEYTRPEQIRLDRALELEIA